MPPRTSRRPSGSSGAREAEARSLNNRVHAIFCDAEGAMWFGTDGGVSRYDGESWQSFTTADGLAENRTLVITQDRRGRMWFGHHAQARARGGITRHLFRE